MQLIKEYIKLAIYILCLVFPKKNKALVHTWPPFDDSALALIPELEKTQLEDIVYLVSGNSRPTLNIKWSTKTRILPKKSLAALYEFITSKYIFFSHQCFINRFPHNVVSVNIWHGMPIKRIGWMSKNKINVPCTKYELATSEFWVPIIKKCMRPWGEVIINGLPRNDRLLLKDKDILIKLKTSSPTFEKMIIWLPTYRVTKLGDLEKDGKQYDNPAQMPDYSEEEFESWLYSNNYLCIIKPHPLSGYEEIKTKGNLQILTEQYLLKKNISLYSLLSSCDLLLTDVSSVYIDFLLTEKPIIHTFPDIDEYSSSRGFTFTLCDDYFAGPVISSMNELLPQIEQAFEADQYADKRKRLRKLFHVPTASTYSEDLLRKLKLL